MNFTQIKYFHAVCVHGSVSKAAEYQHISQPSLSNAIRDLESEYGLQLFYRHHRGMVLTPDGELLLKMSQDLLARAEHTDTILRDMGSRKKVLRLGVPPMIGSLILHRLCGDFLSAHPDITLKITEAGRQELMDKLSEDYLDMVFLSHDQPLDPSLSAIELARLELVCCTSRQNPLSEKSSLTPEDLKDEPLVIFNDGFFLTEQIRKWFAQIGITPNILLQTSQLSAIVSMVSHQIASGFLFRQVAENDPTLVAVPMAKPVSAHISLAWKKEKYLLGTMKKLIAYLQQQDLFA